MGWELVGFFGVEGLDKGICWVFAGANPTHRDKTAMDGAPGR